MTQIPDNSASVEEYWNRPDTISLKDENLRTLELEAISGWLDKNAKVLDIGCGDGVNTIAYANKVQNIKGIDYSSEMIKRARHRISDGRSINLDFQLLSVLELEQLQEQFDIVLSQRCLINLGSFDQQEDVIRRVQTLVRPGGLYLMLEAVEEGREALNEIRIQMGLTPLPMPWHNKFFNESELHPLLEETFEIVKIQDFSLYYLITRTLNEMLDISLGDSLSARMDESAQRIQASLPPNKLSGIGPQRLYVLRVPAN